MKDKKHEVLDEYVGRLKKEALLKAILSALGVGFASLLVTALACWFTEFGGYWIFAVVFVVPFAASLPLFYFFLFYPSEKYVAKRLDRLGLDERILTMVEFEGQDSYIMQRQRADAVATLRKCNSKLVKFAVPATIIALATVGIVAGTRMMTVYGLAEAGKIPSGKELVEDAMADKTEFELVYKVSEEAGLLYSPFCPEGSTEITMKVKKGEDGEIVMFRPAAGFVFTRWADGVKTTLRRDTNVQGKIVATIGFEDLEGGYGDDNETDYNEPKHIREGDGSDDGKNTPPAPPQDGGESNPNDDPNKALSQLQGWVYDGKTDYGGPVFDAAYADMLTELMSGNYDSATRAYIEAYFNAIKR